jgi:hypothetical protein
MRSKLKTTGSKKRVACMMCHHANGPLRKNERIGPTANPPPPALYAARDRKLIGMLADGRGGGSAG